MHLAGSEPGAGASAEVLGVLGIAVHKPHVGLDNVMAANHWVLLITTTTDLGAWILLEPFLA